MGDDQVVLGREVGGEDGEVGRWGDCDETVDNCCFCGCGGDGLEDEVRGQEF